MWDDDDDERKGEGETQCRLIARSSQKAPRGPPGLMSPSDRRIAINSTICLLNTYRVSQNSIDKIGGVAEGTETNILRFGTYGL